MPTSHDVFLYVLFSQEKPAAQASFGVVRPASAMLVCGTIWHRWCEYNGAHTAWTYMTLNILTSCTHTESHMTCGIVLTTTIPRILTPPEQWHSTWNWPPIVYCMIARGTVRCLCSAIGTRRYAGRPAIPSGPGSQVTGCYRQRTVTVMIHDLMLWHTQCEFCIISCESYERRSRPEGRTQRATSFLL